MINIIILIVLLFLCGFFSSAETAFFSANRIKIKHLAKKGNKSALRLLKFFEEPEKILTTILVGNSLVISAAVSMATYALSKIFQGAASVVVVTITTMSMAFLILLFGEISPKIMGMSRADRIALMLINPMHYLYIIFSPPIHVLSFVARQIVRLVGIKEIRSSHDITEEEARTMLDTQIESWHLTKERKKIMQSVFNLKDILVEEVMIPRTDIIGIDINYPTQKIINIIQKSGYSRYPVYEETLDNVKGILIVKDIFSVLAARSHFKVDEFLREAHFIPDATRIEDALKQMQKHKIHAAMVVDEYGGIEGLITLEDILEEIVGEIQDEHDIEESPIVKEQKENAWTIDGDANIRELNEILPSKLPEEDDYNTIGGLIYKIADKIPAENESFKYHNFTFSIIKMEGNKILSVQLKIAD